MKASKFTEEQVAYALRQAAAGTSVMEVCRTGGFSDDTFYQCSFAVNEKEDSLGLNALVVPIRDPRGREVAGLAVHAPLACMDLPTMLCKRDRLEHFAADIARNRFRPQ